MSKLNKVFLAIVIALLVTAVAETLFIFVYKQPQTVPTPVIAETTPAPMTLAVGPGQMKALANWPAFRNATLTLTETVTGTISAIIAQTPTTLFTIKLYGQKGIDTTVFNFPPNEYNKIVVYNQDSLTGSTTKINIGDLKIGDKIRMSMENDLASDVASGSLGIIIYKIKN